MASKKDQALYAQFKEEHPALSKAISVFTLRYPAAKVEIGEDPDKTITVYPDDGDGEITGLEVASHAEAIRWMQHGNPMIRATLAFMEQHPHGNCEINEDCSVTVKVDAPSEHIQFTAVQHAIPFLLGEETDATQTTETALAALTSQSLVPAPFKEADATFAQIDDLLQRHRDGDALAKSEMAMLSSALRLKMQIARFKWADDDRRNR
jgi:hypothetical protein